MIPIDVESVLASKNPNAFFETFAIETDKEKHNINLKISVRDVLRTDGSTGWYFNNLVNKYLYLRVVTLEDEFRFNAINENNYIEILERPISSYFQQVIEKKTKLLTECLGQKNSLDDKELEITSKDNEKIYKFYYDFSFKTKTNSGFVGVLTYIYFDHEQFAKDLGIKAINKRSLIKKFRIDKHANLLAEVSRTKKKSIVRKKQNNQFLWYSNIEKSNDLFFGYLGQEKFSLSEIEEEIFILEKDAVRSSARVPLETYSPKKKRDNTGFEQFNNLSSISDVYHTYDKNGNINFIFSLDLFLVIAKKSNFLKILNIDFIKDYINNGNFLNNTPILNFSVTRTNKNTGEIVKDGFEYTNIENVKLKNSTKMFGKIGSTYIIETENTNQNIQIDLAAGTTLISDPHFFKIIDTNSSILKFGVYDYSLTIGAQDGLRAILKNIHDEAKTGLQLFKEYYSLSEIKSYNNSYYDAAKGLFKEKFILEQNQENSEWVRCKSFFNSYVTLAKLLNFMKRDQPEIQIINSLDPKNTNIDLIKNFIETYALIVDYANNILKTYRDAFLEDTYVLFKKFQPKSEKIFLNYFEDNLFDGQYKSIKPVKNLLKISTNENTITAIRGEDLDFSVAIPSLLPITKNFLLSLSSQEFSYDTNIFLHNILAKHYDTTNPSLPPSNSGARNDFINIVSNELGMFDYMSPEQAGQFYDAHFSFITEYYNKRANNSYLNSFKTDPNIYLFFDLFVLRPVKLEYLEGFEVVVPGQKNTNQIISNKKKITITKNSFLNSFVSTINLKKPVWKFLDYRNINEVIQESSSTIIRLTPLTVSSYTGQKSEEIDLPILNQYFILET